MKLPQLAATLFAIVLLGLPPARAGVTLTVECGWGDRVRADRWVPLFITASDSGKPRNVTIEVYWPHGGQYAMRIRQSGTIGPDPRTFPLLVPIRGWAYQEASVTLTDEDTGKTIAHFPENPGSSSFAQPFFDPGGSLIGISGRRAMLDALQGDTGTPTILTGFLDPERLPESALGFDSLKALVLNQPNLVRSGVGPTALTDVQQQAIVDWVRSGGTLILWPGDGGFPSRSPLVDVLPAKLGERLNLELAKGDRAAAGLPPRFGHMAIYQLEPEPGAQRIPLFNRGQPAAFAKRVGLGRVVLAPLNVGDLQFDDSAMARAVWQPLLGSAVSLTPVPVAAPTTQPTPTTNPAIPGAYPSVYIPPTLTDDQQENIATMSIADFLGNVPGAGEFGFGYIAVALIAMMVIVGPVDWFVLKKLGRQPWTWVTTSGWIALVTVGAVYAGHIFKSGELHYRTIRVIEQADDVTIASTDYVGLYSPRSTGYAVVPPDGESWWQPAGVDASGSSSGLKLPMDFEQTQKGNTPGPMFVNVWSLRFLRGDKVGADVPAIAADLKLEPASAGEGAWRVLGTIRNLTDLPLKNVRVTTVNGSAMCTFTLESSPTTAPAAVTEIPPHATVRVVGNLVIDPPPVTNVPNYGFMYNNTPPPDEANLWSVASQMDLRRVRKIEALVATGDFVSVMAESVAPPAAAKLEGGHQAIERHWQFIRALVPLKKTPE
jgi:hypothetical protein